MTDVRREPHSDDAENLSARLSSSLGRASPKSPAEALQPEMVPPPPSRSRAVRHPLIVFFNFVLTTVIVGVVVVGAGLFVAKIRFEAAGGFDQAQSIPIDRGTSLGAIADRLQQAGLISSKWLFVAGVWLNNQQGKLQAGEYLIPANASMRDIMETMVSGRVLLYSITIPEGLTSQQIIDCLMADTVLVNGHTSGLTDRQIEGCRKAAETLTGSITEVPPEGSLLPETYPFSRGDTRANLINRMRNDRDALLTNVWSRRAPDLPIATPEELVVLASIVEKETSLADERSQVAAVFINRLRLNMPLQSDPTVIFGLFGSAGKPSGFKLSRADLESVSPFNTYVIGGLPPGPIAHAGRASLEAVANPSRTRDLFFVADGSGGHAFAETYEEHLRNVARWREINAGNGASAAPATAAADQSADGDTPAEGVAEDAVGADGTGGPVDAASADAPMTLAPIEPAAAHDAGPMLLQPRPRPAQ